MSRHRVLPCLVVLWLASIAGAAMNAAAPQAAAPQAAAPAGDVTTPEGRRAALDRYCVTCHNARARLGNLALDGVSAERVSEQADVWEQVVRKLRTRTMPPHGMPRPDPATYDRLASYLEDQLDRTTPANPGRPLLRRLNRAEYANSIRDLLDLTVDVRTLLPADDSAFGFDNVGDLLVVSPALLERYLDAADRVSALAVGDPGTAIGAETYYVRGDQSQDQHLEGLPLGTVGGIAVRHTFPLDGEYQLNATLFRNNLEGIRGLEHMHQIEFSVDGQRVFLTSIGGDAEKGQQGSITDRSDATDARLNVRVPVTAGPHVVSAAFIRKTGAGTNRLRPFLRSNSGTYDSTGRPHLESLTVTGPFNPTGPGDTPSRRRIFTCRTDSDRCATEILSTLARRAYRRPVTPADLTRLLAFYREGRRDGTFESGIQLALRRILASPSFVFRIEADPPSPSASARQVPPSPSASARQGPPSPSASARQVPSAYRITDLELATRLSFFLWSSLPDDTLLELAEKNQLRRPAVLEAQVTRMLGDPRAGAFVENFAGQWLHLRNLQTIAPNSDEFPDFDNDLRQGFRREAELFFESILREDRSALDLMTADFTYVNERLAKHYGLPNVYGSHFRRVTLTDDARRGLLGKGSVLMATSHADRTAPVLRGKWILENILGTPPPAPPADVPPLAPKPGAEPKTVRERMEAHRAAPGCASCHRAMDPIGFAMENLDAIGGWRERDAGVPIDASGQLTDGTMVDGVVALRQALIRRPEIFVGTLTEKLMIYALGRGLQHYDMPVVRRIVRDAARDKFRFNSLILGIVKSDPFQMRAKAG